MSKPELFHAWDSLQSFKVRVCLAELGLDWTSHAIVLTELEHLLPDYLAVNPSGLVPALRHDGRVVTESSIINEYLADAFAGAAKGGRLLPEDAGRRARMRAWCHFEDTVVHPAVRPPTFNLHVKPLASAVPRESFDARIAAHPLPERAQAYRAAVLQPFDPAAVIASIRAFSEIIARIDTAVSEHKWLVSNRFSLADVAMSAFVERLDSLHMTSLWRDRPGAHAWAGAIRDRPSYHAAIGKERAPNLVDETLVRRLIAEAAPA